MNDLLNLKSWNTTLLVVAQTSAISVLKNCASDQSAHNGSLVLTKEECVNFQDTHTHVVTAQ